MAGSNIDRLSNHVEQMNDGGNSTHKTMGKRRKRIEMAPLKSGWTGAISAYAREQNNVDVAQQQEPLFLALDSVHHVDRIVPPTIDENYNRREVTERLVQHGVGASSFGVYGNNDAISISQQEQNKEVDNNEVTNVISASAQQQNNEMMMAHQRGDLSLEDWMASITVEDEDLQVIGSFHERPSFNQADEPRGDPSQPPNDQLCSLSVNNDVIVNDAQQREPEWANDFIGGGIELGRYTPETIPITEQANPETEFARDHCSPEELPHDTFQTIPRTEPVVQVLGQSNVELDNFSVGAERTQVEEEEEDMLNNSGRVAQPGAGASSSGGLRHNPSETRGAPCSTKLVGRAFEENRNVIWSWLTDDEVSIIGIYGMAGAGKTTLLKHICNELQRSPDIYYPVYWVTLSPDFSIHKLQNKIAKCIQLSFSNEEKELGLRAEKLSQKLMKKQRCWKEEELGRRAKELSQELMKKQRWILILDNLCNSFELNKVGIPVPFKRCKLIMTTRSEEVCLQMNSKYNVRVNPLPREESWTLWYLQGGFLCCQGQGRKRIEMARLKSGWTLLMTNLILEIASAGFDQLGYALVGMVLAFVALVLAAADLIHMPRKERTSLPTILPSFHRQSASTFAPGNPVGTIVEYFGLVGGVWQCFYSTVEYAYAHQKRDNPIKMCLLPFLFLSCVVISILIKKSYIDKRA